MKSTYHSVPNTVNAITNAEMDTADPRLDSTFTAREYPVNLPC